MKTLDAVLHEAMEWRRETFPADHPYSLSSRLAGEVDELRSAQADSLVSGDNPVAIAHELADCMIFLTAIAEAEEFDLAQAVADKLAINRTRTWVKP